MYRWLRYFVSGGGWGEWDMVCSGARVGSCSSLDGSGGFHNVVSRIQASQRDRGTLLWEAETIKCSNLGFRDVVPSLNSLASQVHSPSLHPPYS